jgi:hypothetical protein
LRTRKTKKVFDFKIKSFLKIKSIQLFRGRLAAGMKATAGNGLENGMGSD